MKIIGFKKQQKMTKNLKFLEGRNLPSIQKTTKTLIILFILLLLKLKNVNDHHRSENNIEIELLGIIYNEYYHL